MNWIRQFIAGYRSVRPTHDEWGSRLMVLFFIVIALDTLAFVSFA